MEKLTHPIKVMFTEKDMKKIKECAKKDQRSIGNYIRKAVLEYMKNH